MIDTVAALLEGLIDCEQAILDAERLPHAPTIGQMYEALTRTTLERAIPRELDIRIAHGFVVDHTGRSSRQIDCMVVLGEGRAIPKLDARQYLVDNVIAVIEVKKSLYSADLEDGYRNLESVLVLENSRLPPHIDECVRRRFQIITRTPVPAHIERAPRQHELLWRMLVVEMARPVRILLGYHGFRSESSFRKGILEFLAKHTGEVGYGPMSMPQLVLNRSHAMAKNNGMPWISSWDDAGTWPLLSTTSGRGTAFLLLEAIWSRLADRGFVGSSIFGDDRNLEAWNRLADVTFRDPPGGWAYDLWEAAVRHPATSAADKRWEPHEVSAEQVSLIAELGLRGVLRVDRQDPRSGPILLALRDLQAKALVGEILDCPGNWIPLVAQLTAVSTGDGKHYAADDISGRLRRWLADRA